MCFFLHVFLFFNGFMILWFLVDWYNKRMNDIIIISVIDWLIDWATFNVPPGHIEDEISVIGNINGNKIHL